MSFGLSGKVRGVGGGSGVFDSLDHLIKDSRPPWISLCSNNTAKFNCVQSNRGDKTAIELFVAGIRGWGSWRWRQLENSQST